MFLKKNEDRNYTCTVFSLHRVKHGIATTLMYQLYIALNNKAKSNLTGVAIETMRPRAPVKLESMERPIYVDVSVWQ